jgi:hypothetical protein
MGCDLGGATIHDHFAEFGGFAAWESLLSGYQTVLVGVVTG